MAVLRLAQDASRAADLQVSHRDPEAASEVCVLPDGAQSLLRHFPEHLVSLVHEKGIGRAPCSPHAPAELIEL